MSVHINRWGFRNYNLFAQIGRPGRLAHTRFCKTHLQSAFQFVTYLCMEHKLQEKLKVLMSVVSSMRSVEGLVW